MNEPTATCITHSAHQAGSPVNWSTWARRLLVCNPFYLCSAALFLFGINRLPIDPGFLSDETANLIFNFSALEIYELIVIATALLLARRRIWYDSALLVVIDAGLVLVPFFLISHAVVTGRGLGLAFAAIAVVLAVVRYTGIRQFYPTFNLPGRALVLGLVILLFNAALPFAFWPWVKPDMDRWFIPNNALWYVVLPLFVAGTNLLAVPARYGGSNQERQWLPLFVCALWIAGTAVHVWCVGYLCSMKFRLDLIAPLTLAAAWTARHRARDFVQHPTSNHKLGLLLVTFLPPLFAATKPLLFELLLTLNLIAYSTLWARSDGKERRIALELIVATSLLMLAGAAVWLLPGWQPGFSHRQVLAIVVVGAVCAYAIRSRLPALGVLAAALIYLVATLGARDLPKFVPFHAASIFLLLQSLTWRVSNPGHVALRIIASAIWILNALSWFAGDVLTAKIAIVGEGMFVLGVAITVRLVYGSWRSTVVPVCAGIILLLYPMIALVHHGSPGLIAIATSTLLFALGTLLAWTRHRWHDAPRSQ